MNKKEWLRTQPWNPTAKNYFRKTLPTKKKKEKKDPRNHPFPTILSAPPNDLIHLISLLGIKQQIIQSWIILTNFSAKGGCVESDPISVKDGDHANKEIFSNPSIFSADWLSIFLYPLLPVIFLGNMYIKWMIQEFDTSSMTFSILITIISILSHKSNSVGNKYLHPSYLVLWNFSPFLHVLPLSLTCSESVLLSSLLTSISLVYLPVPSGCHSTPHPVCISWPFRLHVYSILNSFSFPSHTDPLPYLLTNHWLYLTQSMSVSPQLLRISRKKSLNQYNIQYQVWGLFRSQSQTWFCYLLPGKVWASDITSLNLFSNL